MSECVWDSDDVETDTDITDPGENNQTNRTVTDRLIKKPSHNEDFASVWNESVIIDYKNIGFLVIKILGSCIAFQASMQLCIR